MPTKAAELKKHIVITRLVAPYTNGLKPTGRNWFVGRCPFCQTDKDPAGKKRFWVNGEKGYCGCFNTKCLAFCDRRVDPTAKPMDVINFWAKLHGLTNAEAIRELWELYQQGKI